MSGRRDHIVFTARSARARLVNAVSSSSTRPARRFLPRVRIGAAIALALVAAPGNAQSVLRDAETEALFRDMSAPLIRASGLNPADVRVVLVGDKSINAFVAGGQVVYVHSGLIEAADSANQVQGVIAHELGHVAGGHAVINPGAERATTIALLSLLAGIVAGVAGSGEAGMGVMAAGQQAALGSYLAFSRRQEATADAAGMRYLSAAGISGRGSLEFFQKLLNQEMRFAVSQSDDAAYNRTHPLSGDRIRFLRDSYSSDPAWTRASDAAIEARFLRVKAKLYGYVTEPARVLQRYPASDTSVSARYARAYALHRSAHPTEALAEARALRAGAPNDPYFAELEGQILLESGRPTEALAPLREAVQATQAQPLIAALFGHALIATENPANYAEAERVLKAAVARDNDNPFAWYQLGVIYTQRGDEARAALATAERAMLIGETRLALISAERAGQVLPAHSPDALRAQDIALVARSRLERERRQSRQGRSAA